MSSYNNSFVILGKLATIDVNQRGNHVRIDLDGMIIADTSGDIGFWECFNNKRESSCKGAAYRSALDKYAREYVESEIVEYVRFAQQKIAEAA